MKAYGVNSRLKRGSNVIRKYAVVLFIIALSGAWTVAVAAQNVPGEARLYMARGVAAVEMAKTPGDYVLAAMEFDKAAKLAPDWPDVYYTLGSVQVKMGDTASAIKSFQRYLELAPASQDAEKVRQEIYKLEYRRDREQLAAARQGPWKASNGQTFTLALDGSRIQLTRDAQQGDDIITIKAAGTEHTGLMTDAPQLVFVGTLIGEKVMGQYLQPAGKSSAHCTLPERRGLFEGTVDIAAGTMRLAYTYVKLEYEMKFRSLLSDELVCTLIDRKEMPCVLELKRAAPGPALRK